MAKKYFIEKLATKNGGSPFSRPESEAESGSRCQKNLPFFFGAMINQIENRVYICLGQFRKRNQLERPTAPLFPAILTENPMD